MREPHLDHQHAASLADGTALGLGRDGSAVSNVDHRLGCRETRYHWWPEQLTAPSELLLADTPGGAVPGGNVATSGDRPMPDTALHTSGCRGSMPSQVPPGSGDKTTDLRRGQAARSAADKPPNACHQGPSHRLAPHSGCGDGS